MVPLSATEEAFLTMILEEHAGLIQRADARRNQRMAVLLKEKSVPSDVPVTVEPRQGDQPAFLAYDSESTSATSGS